MEFPSQLKYTKDHEWLETQAGASAKVGVTAFAIDQLGDVVHLELPSVGETFDADASFGTIESTKTVSDLYMPVAGKIVEVNTDMLGALDTLKDDPYSEGWLVRIEATNPGDYAKLLSAGDYETFISEQE